MPVPYVYHNTYRDNNDREMYLFYRGMIINLLYIGILMGRICVKQCYVRIMETESYIFWKPNVTGLKDVYKIQTLLWPYKLWMYNLKQSYSYAAFTESYRTAQHE